MFDLKVVKTNYYIDDTRDIEKSTRATCKYLKRMHKQFDDWYLAFAAYNCGASRVLKEIKRSNSNNFWDLNFGYRRRMKQENHFPAYY